MSHAIWYDVPFRCLNCGAVIPAADTPVYTSGLNPEAWDLRLAPGKPIGMHRNDFGDAFRAIGQVSSTDEIRALEEWSCPACGAAQFARLVFKPVPPSAYELTAAETVAMTPETARRSNMVSPKVISHLQIDVDRYAEVLKALSIAK